MPVVLLVFIIAVVLSLAADTRHPMRAEMRRRQRCQPLDPDTGEDDMDQRASGD